MNKRFAASSSLFRRLPRRNRRARQPAEPRNARFRVVRRPPVPLFWRNIAPVLRAGPGTPHPYRHKNWLLVLQAKSIPFHFQDKQPLSALHVPPIAAKAAIHEITAFEAERPTPPLPQPADRRGTYWYALLLALLVPWHRMRWDTSFALPFLPGKASDWLSLGGLDAYKAATLHEWRRAFTALTLHADGPHLMSNVVMGCVFGVPLCRHTGVGLGFFLTIFSGALGNMATAWLRPASAVSQGFSTAVFASIGLLAAFSAAFAARTAYAAHAERRKCAAVKYGVWKGLLPLGAGLGLLAMLGGSSEPNVDYLAHAMGLLSGIVVGLAASFGAGGVFRAKGAKNAMLQWGALVAGMAAIGLSWHWALQSAV